MTELSTKSGLMIDIIQKCLKYFYNFRVKMNLESQTNQQTIHNDLTNSNTKRQIKTKEFIIYANTQYYLNRNIKQYFNVCNLFLKGYYVILQKQL